MTFLPTDPPSSEEFELALFGRGIGESVLLHMGDSQWIVVDSFLNPTTKAPIALDYLNSIGVDPETGISLVVVTHWHDDHTRGAARVLEHALNAEMVCSGAFRRGEFLEFVGASESFGMEDCGIGEFRRMMEIVMDRMDGRQQSRGPIFASENKTIFRSDHGAVVSLSPSDGCQALAMHELCSILPKSGEEKRHTVSQGPNSISVALSATFHNTTSILGGDLEYTRDRRTGWRAVIESKTRPEGLARIYKVPHHGSSNADHRDIWPALMDGKPIACLTPYARGTKKRPSYADIRRLKTRAGPVYVAGALQSKPRKLSYPVSRELRRRGRISLGGRVGMVRIRVNKRGDISTALFGATKQR